MKKRIAIFKINYDSKNIKHMKTILVKFFKFLKWEWWSKNYNEYYGRKDIMAWDVTGCTDEFLLINKIQEIANTWFHVIDIKWDFKIS
jgi:hypothetical protein